jgi:hypothetical protein
MRDTELTRTAFGYLPSVISYRILRSPQVYVSQVSHSWLMLAWRWKIHSIFWNTFYPEDDGAHRYYEQILAASFCWVTVFFPA